MWNSCVNVVDERDIGQFFICPSMNEMYSCPLQLMHYQITLGILQLLNFANDTILCKLNSINVFKNYNLSFGWWNYLQLMFIYR
jgi:hypothetical protein